MDVLKQTKKKNEKKIEKKNPPQTPTTRSPGSLLVSLQNEPPECTVARTSPRFRVWGSSRRKESLPPIFALLKILQSGTILRTNISQKRNCCGFPARKHPTPPGTGTGTNGSSELGATPALGTRQFSQALLAVGPPVGTDPREMTTQKNYPNFYFSKEPCTTS